MELCEALWQITKHFRHCKIHYSQTALCACYNNEVSNRGIDNDKLSVMSTKRGGGGG